MESTKCLIRGAELLAGVAARTEPSGGEYEKHLRAEPQDWTGGGGKCPNKLGANGQRNKNTRMAFGTINIGAHAKTHMRCTIVSQAFQERGQLF